MNSDIDYDEQDLAEHQDGECADGCRYCAHDHMIGLEAEAMDHDDTIRAIINLAETLHGPVDVEGICASCDIIKKAKRMFGVP